MLKIDVIQERITYSQKCMHTTTCKRIDSSLKMHITILDFNFLDSDNYSVSPHSHNL